MLNIQTSESTRFQDHQSRPGLGILSGLRNRGDVISKQVHCI